MICTLSERVPGERGRREHGGRRLRCHHCGTQVCHCVPGVARQFTPGRGERAGLGGRLRTKGGGKSAGGGERTAGNTGCYLLTPSGPPPSPAETPEAPARGAVPGPGARPPRLQFLWWPFEGARDRGGHPGLFQNVFKEHFPVMAYLNT